MSEPPAERDPGTPERPLTPLERLDAGHEPRVVPPMWDAMAYMLTGPIMLGLPAYLLDRILGTTWLVLPGVLIGGAVSLYLVWVRYGRS